MVVKQQAVLARVVVVSNSLAAPRRKLDVRIYELTCEEQFLEFA
jgi:hypothetical protein